MTKLSKKQRKKLKEREEKKKQIEEAKGFSNDELLNRTLEPTWKTGNVDIHNPLVLEFFRALKNQKVYGRFCKWYEIKTLLPFERVEALRSKGFVDIGDLSVIPDNSDFIKRVKVLNRMIDCNNYDRSYNWNGITVPRAFEAYAKEYFSSKGAVNSGSPLHYQFMFGTASLIIGMLIIFGIIYYFWGKTVLVAVLFLILVYSGLGIYKLCKF